MTVSTDVLIIGAGIAGVSLAHELAASMKVAVVEAEPRAGYHASGRSAALFSEIYGSPEVRALTRESRPFYETPPPGFPAQLLTPRGVLYVATEAMRDDLDRLGADGDVKASTRALNAAEAYARVPILQGVVAALYEPAATDIDTGALHQSYLRSARVQGAEVRLDARVERISRAGRRWSVDTGGGRIEADILVNAAGAWADGLAELAGLPPVGLSPMRRTALVIEPPDRVDPRAWPLTITADESIYFKPDAGRLLVSPADETPSAPCDAAPEVEDVALAAFRFEALTGREVRRVVSKWAGLRTFSRDRNPVVGFDPLAEGFFWLAGQGGYGFQTAPAIARLAARLIGGKEAGPLAPAVSPSRFRLAQAAASINR
ncbi:MAG: NAD(P)/FAD-dependent oxidoreductase [Caulobacteraceae bacterium]